eukprot:TRINITY_DN7006_c0_g2_i1.p1 TRINITY_DN7006_c0_g2~~TRINITY_DN7006_c0_g2_i1.p1  ORF type:complete len:624 (-),score=139.64 TRINITY_DN7006_c0_g2_i1:120-1991(-)
MGRKQDKASAARKAEKAKAAGNNTGGASKANNNERLTSEQLGFNIRTGPDAPSRTGASMDIDVRDVVVTAGRQELLYNAVLKLSKGFKYGLVGRNGVGKSTLLRAMAERDGRVPVPKHMLMCHVEQEIVGDDTPVLESVLSADEERTWLLETEHALLNAEDGGEPGEERRIHGVGLMEVYERLEELGNEDAESRAGVILSGLGFSGEDQQRPTREFSGGWRMRIALARALFVQPDLLLLDEPTNHLDVPAVTWLEEFLKAWEKTAVIVSHDRTFLNECTTHTIFLHRKRLFYYGGSYDTFLRVRAEQRANQEAVKGIQDRRVAHLKQFIARFGRGHKKMARQAQSRMKMLDKMQEEAVEVDFDDPYLKLDFPSAPELPPPCISVIDAAFGYTEERTLYKDLNFGVDCDSRVAIVGPNGAGKSTFLKLLDGGLVPTEGSVRRHAKLHIARFTQHHVEMMDPEQDAVTHMRRLGGGIREDGTSEVTIEEARKYLGRFGLQGDLALQPVRCLSGGQKSRLAFAELAWSSPHLLLLDEPTNHLDLETIEGLAMALNKFEGGVVLVSHDDRLVSLIADELWVVMPGPSKDVPGSVTVFEGSFDEYKEMLRNDFIRKNMTTGGRIKRRD